ncbi:MAG: anaerobic glycerol-3-phosphate dehydrogenase subunit C [Candidatus Binatia bacterium]
MLTIYLREPSCEAARRRTAAARARRVLPPPPTAVTLARERERAVTRLEELTAHCTTALEARGITVTHAPSAAAAADRIAALAAATPVAVTRAAVIGELVAALRKRSVDVVPTYGPGRMGFEARWHRFWELSPLVPAANWRTRPVVDGNTDRRDVVGLFGVNALSATTGSIYLLQHSQNISDLLRAARRLIFIAGVDKIAIDDAAAGRQVEAASTYGVSSVLLDLARTPPLGSPLEHFPPVSGSPVTEVILLDNGRKDLRDGPYRSLLACIGCRACATRCPTYPAFRGAQGWNPKDYLWSHVRGDNPSLDLCTFCGNCEVDCPVEIPLPTLIASRRAESIRTRGRRLAGWRRRVQGDVGRLSKAFAATAPLSNRAPRLPLAPTVMEKVFGLAPERPLPTFRRDTFESRYVNRTSGVAFQQRSRRSATAGRTGLPPQPAGDCGDRQGGSGRQRLVYYFGCFANYNDPEVGHATLAVLEALGYEVVLPAWQCCGIPLYAKGEVAAARRLAAANVAALAPYVDTGHEVVTSCPSCQLALARDYPRLFPSPAAERVARHTHFLSRFLCDVDGLDQRLRPMPRHAAYHLPCHLRALDMAGDSLQLLSKIPGLRVTDVNRGCCGLSGTFGLERAHYATSMDIGAGLFAAMANPEFDLVLTDCGACKLQVEHGTGRSVTHPVELVCRAISDRSALLQPGVERVGVTPASVSPPAGAAA